MKLRALDPITMTILILGITELTKFVFSEPICKVKSKTELGVEYDIPYKCSDVANLKPTNVAKPRVSVTTSRTIEPI